VQVLLVQDRVYVNHQRVTVLFLQLPRHDTLLPFWVVLTQKLRLLPLQECVVSPRLRRVAEIMTNSIEFYSLKKACELANVNYDSAKTMIARYRKKGIDFNEFVSSKTIELLKKVKYDVYRSLRDRAISGSLGHQKLYSQVVGDYTERQQVDHNLTAKIVLFSPSTIPEDIQKLREQERDKDGVQIIDADFDD